MQNTLNSIHLNHFHVEKQGANDICMMNELENEYFTKNFLHLKPMDS